jgi:hypothetical protein
VRWVRGSGEVWKSNLNRAIAVQEELATEREERLSELARLSMPKTSHSLLGVARGAVADETAVLSSSANLTEFALALNMELGLLVRGGDLLSQVVDHLRRLIESGILTRQLRVST